jgi:N12 class adenine-specific DNA methylase/adenine-specific DNA methylase
VMAKLQLANGEISPREYARMVANRVRGSRAQSKASIDDQFTEVEPGTSIDDQFTEVPSSAIGGDDWDMKAAAQQKAIDDQPTLDYLKKKGVHGWEGMKQSLDVAKWAVGGVDDVTMAEQLANKMQADSRLNKTTDEMENDAAWKRVSKADGFIDTTKEAFKAIGTSLSNPKATLGEIIEQGSNSIPTLVAGIGGAGAGAAAGAGIGAAAGGVGAVPAAIGGAIIGGRSGMAAGTIAIEGAGQIQEFIGTRLAEKNQAPTAQNILAMLSSPEFKEEAVKQGLSKGLTVALVDQVTMSIGGKMATAPARKIATKDLSDKGIDVSTRTARNEALASPAGKAAMEAAKPTMGARVGAGAAAVGIDAAGEVVGDFGGSVAADGTGDIGESMRGGLMSIGQSGISVAVGSTIETAKLAAAQAKSAMKPVPPKAPGPLTRATENAADTPERVIVTAPDGQVSGSVTAKAPGVVQIVGDDGQVYNFSTGPNGVQITPEAPTAPLSGALEAAAQEHVIAEAAPTAEAAPVVAPVVEAPVVEAPVVEQPAPSETQAPVAPSLSEMDEPALRARLKYIAQQAKTNGGWNSMPTTARREVEREINARATTVEEPEQPAPITPETGIQAEPAPVLAPAITPESTKPSKTEKIGPASLGSAKADLDHLFGVDAKRAKALERIAKGTAYFHDGVKAKDFIAKNGLSETHEVKRGKGGRFDVVAKATVKESLTAQNERETRISTTLANGGHVVGDELRMSNGMAQMKLTAEELATIPADKVRAKPSADAARTKVEREEEDKPTATVQPEAAAKEEVAPEKPREINGFKAGDVVDVDGRTIKGWVVDEVYMAPSPLGGNDWLGMAKVRSPEGKTLEVFAESLRKAATKQEAPGTRINGEVEKAKKPNKRGAKRLFDGAALTDAENSVAPNADAFALFEAEGKDAEFWSLLSRRTEDKNSLSDAEESRFFDLRAERNAAIAASKNAGAADGEVDQNRRKKESDYWAQKGKRIADGQNDELDAEMRSYEDKAEQKPAEQPKPDPFANNKLFTSDKVAAARARLKSKLNNLNSGIDPETVMDGMTIAGAYLESGVRSFSAYAKAMTEDFGDKIKPYLLSFYEAARHYPGLNNDGMSSPVSAQAQHEAMMLAYAEVEKSKESATQEKQENGNEPQELDQPRTRELEGKQPDALQGAEPQRKAGASPEGSGGTDLLGDERAGSPGREQSGRMGNDAGEVSAAASGTAAGRGGKQGGRSVQGGKRPAKPDSSVSERGNQPELIPETGTRAQDRSNDFVITEDDGIGEGGQKTKFKQNVAAIRLLKQLEAENRQATRAEQAVLAKYVGWGGIPQAFYRDNNEVSKGWEKEAAELKEVLTAAELDSAAASTRNAHYTSPEIVEGMWDAVKHFGFQGGRVQEPSVGVGNFFGLMPTGLRSASQLTGIELDHITGGIAKQLYPQADIHAPVGFQDFSAPDNYFDLAIGNPPFGAEKIYDGNRRKISGFSIHNYFFAKSIDTVKPNGVLAMVVTNRLLDSMGDKARQYMADRAEFLGAVRLPNNAFAKNAGTEVTTDIIFLRKLKDGEQPTGQRWMDVKQYKDKDGNTVPLNEYFARNPDMMLGEFGQFGTMYRPDDSALVARPGQDTKALLQEAISKLPKGFMDGPTAAPVFETVQPMHDVSHVKIGSVFEQGGQIFERREDMLGKQQAVPVAFANDKARERVTGMIAVRDALIDVRRLQLQENMPEANLAAARAELNKAYDAFVKANGPINADANKRLMRDDPTWPQLAALEDYFDKGISATVAKTTGEKARPPSAKKAAIFSKRTQSPYKSPEKANSAKDALVTSLSERGRVDLDYMASLYGKTPEAIATELHGLIFRNPAGGWESSDQYLSGNVKKKLAQAIDAAKSDSSMKANVDALRAVQPADIEAVDIDVKTGAHWLPADVMQSFVERISEGQNAKAVYNPVTASWTLNVDRASQAAQTQWSTDRASLTNILEHAANQKQITVYDKHSDGSRTLNEAATTAANEKIERVKAEWKSWIWSDDQRRERLARIYNDTFNTDVQRDFDGSHLTFAGKVGDDIITLRPHQANAVWRMVQSGTTLLDHVVGAGKTFTMIAGIMEMRRMGMAKKPMLVVPNHLVGQWAEDFMKLYPGANILAATKKDFEKDSRKKLFARIATGDWDAVIVAHSSFGKVEVEPEFQAEFIKQQIADMDTSISAMREAEGKGSRNVKQIEKQKATLEEKLKKLFDTGTKDDNLYFGELGVDGIFLDEAHEFKNLGFSTGMQRVAGLGNPSGSNKAADMFMKAQSVLRRTGGRNVVFATGTPISNTMAEMYTMQRYLDYGTLKDQGIAHFDAWAKTFGEVVTDWELSPSGQYKMNSRFAKFVNMPELMQRYQSFADVINRDDINRQLAEQGKKLPVPKVAGGKPENRVVERSADQANFIGVPTIDENGVESYPEGSLIWRSENLPKKVSKGSDNMLKIMSDARKAALDMRLINPNYPDNPGSKVNVAADEIKGIYDQTSADKGAQLVFIDLSTPKGAKAKEAAALRDLMAKAQEGDESAQEKLDAMSPDELLALDSQFSVYDDLKAKLIAKGIPENEIAFIHDANTELQKEDLFGKVRSGRIRVLLGSTAKMGAGMNVQERLVALHHLDAPWRPSDLEQREGRIIRQGNKLYEADPENFEIQIKRYATKQTLDSRMWQTIEAKARFIEQVRKGAGTSREIEDVAGEAANSAEMKAASSGNPLILEEMSLRQSIRKLESSQSEYYREQHRIKDRVRSSGDMARKYDRDAAQMAADAPLVPGEFAVTIGNQTFDKHGEAGEAILSAIKAMMDDGKATREIGTYGGFKLHVDDISQSLIDKRAVLTLVGNGEYQVEANPGSSPQGLALRMQNTVKGLATEAEKAKASAQRYRDDIPKLEAQIKPWGHNEELADAKARHTSLIDQLKPKKKAEKPADEAPAFSRANDQTSDAMSYIEDNFWDILGELEESGKVAIRC